jgi:diazepam-binding inhibitor (GABA receptor modulator, acyl-CoA-binding protein)
MATAALKKKFEQAATDSKKLSSRPDNNTLLKIYSLYKQGSIGDNEEKKPGLTDMVGRAKWDAWNKLKGTSQDEAMQQYVDLIDSLK